ncbi:MAG: hypothetical protein ACRDH5_09305, partial [bacterium]
TDAQASGYVRLRPTGPIPALNPLTGEHWLNHRNLRVATLELDRPAYLMYYPMHGEERLVGMGYAMIQIAGAVPPAGFDGAGDVWHRHFSCRDLPDFGTFLVASAVECGELGGRPGETQIAMVHVWLDPPNPEGPFAAVNVTLPFVAAGLRPPTREVLADSVRGRRARTLALALGESFGALPRMGGMVEIGRDSSAFRGRVSAHRAALRALVVELRQAERRGDREAYDRTVDRALAEWEPIRQAYLDHAPYVVLRTLLDRWFHAVVEPERHGHAGH